MEIHGIGPDTLARIASTSAPQSDRAEGNFGKIVLQVLGDANSQQQHADSMVQKLATGQVDNLHEVMLAVVKADLSLRTVLEIRNRLTEAYQEVMRMQV